MMMLRDGEGLKGLGFPAGYAAVGYCPGTNNPNYMSFPDGSMHCVTDAEMMKLAFTNFDPYAVVATGDPGPAVSATAEQQAQIAVQLSQGGVLGIKPPSDSVPVAVPTVQLLQPGGTTQTYTYNPPAPAAQTNAAADALGQGSNALANSLNSVSTGFDMSSIPTWGWIAAAGAAALLLMRK